VLPFFLAILALAVSSTFCFAAGINAQEGEWESTVEMKMEGLPFAIPPVTTKHCVTKENVVPKASEKDDRCKTKDQKIVGNKVTWSVECMDKDGKSESEGGITCSGNSYKGTMKTRMTDKTGKTMVSTGTMTGRRIGECTDKDKRSVSVGGREVQQPDPALMEQAKKAQAESENRQKEQKARWEELARLSVPEEDAGSCGLSGENFQDPKCESKVEKLNLKPGEWEITTQEGVDQMGFPRVGDPKKTTECLTQESPMISTVQKSSEKKLPGVPQRSPGDSIKPIPQRWMRGVELFTRGIPWKARSSGRKSTVAEARSCTRQRSPAGVSETGPAWRRDEIIVPRAGIILPRNANLSPAARANCPTLRRSSGNYSVFSPS
jgi:hypothetical protein